MILYFLFDLLYSNKKYKMANSDPANVKALHYIALPFYIWILATVNLVNRKSCGCKSNVVTGINIMTALQIFVSIVFLITTDKNSFGAILLMWMVLSTINIILYFVFFTQIKNQNCLCYRKYKGSLIALLVFNVVGFLFTGGPFIYASILTVYAKSSI